MNNHVMLIGKIYNDVEKYTGVPSNKINTRLKRISDRIKKRWCLEDHSHIKPTLSMAITLDHIFSIIIAVAGGFIWDKLDYRWVFLAGALIAVINFISVMKIKIEK